MFAILLIYFSVGRASWNQMRLVMLRKQQHSPKGGNQSGIFLLLMNNVGFIS